MLRVEVCEKTAEKEASKKLLDYFLEAPSSYFYAI